MRMFKPREYQIELADRASDILQRLNIVYLAMEVRTGKTFTSLMVAERSGAQKILFLTKKKAIKGIEKDIETFGKLDVDVLSVDSAHKADGEYDLIIVDEAHGLGAFPKTSLRARNIRKISSMKPIILLSGTPNPESLSQLYHQFWISDFSPWKNYRSFYGWAKDHVDVFERPINGHRVRNYSKARRELIQPIIDRYFVTFSQEEAGFRCKVNEHITYVRMKPYTYELIERLKQDRVIQGKAGVVLGDTSVKLMSKVHQLSSGTVKNEDGDVILVDDTKAKTIFERFKRRKTAIFYKYKGELELLRQVYGDGLTEDVEEFNETDKDIALQIRSGSEGVNLSKADIQVFMSIDFSAKDYIQAKARQQTQQRESCDVVFLFAESGIEPKIMQMLKRKKDFTTRYFMKHCI